MADNATRLDVVIHGRVQGVGFRWWTQRLAQGLGLRGSVWNRPDGGVEVHAVGPDAAVASLAQALRKGPPTARVDAVADVAPLDDVPAEGFVIGRRSS